MFGLSNKVFFNTALFFIGLLLFGCGRSAVGTDSELGINISPLEFPEYVENVSMVRIAETNDMLLADVSKAVLLDDSTFILMDTRQHALLKVAADGSILDMFKNTGRGPKEYLQVLDFDIDMDHNVIYLLCEPRRLLVLDTNFNILNVLSLDEDFRRIAYFEGELYAYVHETWSVYRLNEDSTSTLYIKSERSNDGIFFSPRPVFHKIDGGILVNMAGDDIIYEIKDGTCDKYFTLNFPDKEKCYNTLSKITPDDFLAYAKNSAPKIYNIFSVDDRTFRIIYSYKTLYRMALCDIETGCVLEDGVLGNLLNAATPVLNIDNHPFVFFCSRFFGK